MSEKVFTTASVSVKLNPKELSFLESRIAAIDPVFIGTKTDALRKLFADYEQTILEYSQLSELDDEKVQELKEQLSLKEQELQERMTFIQEMEEIPDNDLGFSEDQMKNLKILAYLAYKEEFIDSYSVSELVHKILLHYQSSGNFMPNEEEIKKAKIFLEIE